MSPKNANAVDNFLHDFGNSLSIIGGLAKRHKLDFIGLEVKLLRRAIERWRKETRKCPYAKEKGAKCGHVPH